MTSRPHSETDKAWEFEHKMMERATEAEEKLEDLQEQLEALREALQQIAELRLDESLDAPLAQARARHQMHVIAREALASFPATARHEREWLGDAM